MAGQKISKETIKAAIMEVIEKRPKATLRTLKAIGDAEGDITTAVLMDDGKLDYGRIATLFCYAAQQVNPSVTVDDVLDAIDLDMLGDAMGAITNFYAIRIPEGVIPKEMLANEPDDEKVAGQEKLKNLP